MRLLVVSSRYPFGTKETYLRTELSELASYFDRVAVVPLRPPSGQAQPVPPAVEVLAWSMLSPGIVWRAARMAIARPRRVARALWTVAASKDRGRAKNAVVVFKALALAHWALEHRIGHIHAYWLSAPATVAMVAAQIAGIPWSATAHRWDIYERNALDVKALSAAFVRTISERGARDLQAQNPLLNGRIVCLPIGAVVPRRSPWQAERRGPLHVLCPAALVGVKGHEDLIEALAILRDRGVDAECTIAGEGPLRETLERRVRERGLDAAVRFSGFVPQDQLHQWYCEGGIDAVVLASRHDEREMEGVPSALVEAMAYGVPVVTTSSGSIPELVDDVCGHVVPPSDPAALADALYDVYDRPFEAKGRAASAYARVSSTHDVRRQMRALSERIHS